MGEQAAESTRRQPGAGVPSPLGVGACGARPERARAHGSGARGPWARASLENTQFWTLCAVSGAIVVVRHVVVRSMAHLKALYAYVIDPQSYGVTNAPQPPRNVPKLSIGTLTLSDGPVLPNRSLAAQTRPSKGH